MDYAANLPCSNMLYGPLDYGKLDPILIAEDFRQFLKKRFPYSNYLRQCLYPAPDMRFHIPNVALDTSYPHQAWQWLHSDEHTNSQEITLFWKPVYE